MLAQFRSSPFGKLIILSLFVPIILLVTIVLRVGAANTNTYPVFPAIILGASLALQ